MKNSALISLLLVLMSSCSVSLFNNYKPVVMPAADVTDSYSWFREDTGRYLFRSSIDLYRNNFSGLLFIKPLDDNRHRIIFITELGLRIFDMEFEGSSNFKLNYCLEEMNRKPVINTLKRDFSLMLYNVPLNGSVRMMKDKKTGQLIVRSKDENGMWYCFVNEDNGKIGEVISTGVFTNKTNIRYFSGSGSVIDSLIITHYNVKLRIHLSTLTEYGTEILK